MRGMTARGNALLIWPAGRKILGISASLGRAEEPDGVSEMRCTYAASTFGERDCTLFASACSGKRKQ